MVAVRCARALVACRKDIVIMCGARTPACRVETPLDTSVCNRAGVGMSANEGDFTREPLPVPQPPHTSHPAPDRSLPATPPPRDLQTPARKTAGPAAEPERPSIAPAISAHAR